MLSPGSASPSTQGGASGRQSQDSTPASILGVQHCQNTPEHRAYDGRFQGASPLLEVHPGIEVSPFHTLWGRHSEVELVGLVN